MIFIPIGLAGIAVILFFVGRGQNKKAYDMKSVQTSTAAELARSAADVSKEIGVGSFSQQAEVKGTAECASPLKSEMNGSDCVWYRSTVTREYEESYTERDSEGHTKTGTRRGSETVSSNERSVPFQLRDESGTITIDPEGASIDGERIVSQFEQGDRGPSLSFGNFRLNLGALGSGRRTIGYKLEEWAITLGKRLYVLGEARDDENRLRIGKPAKKGERFIISVKSEEDLTKSAESGAKIMSIVAIVLGVGAIVSAVVILFF